MNEHQFKRWTSIYLKAEQTSIQKMNSNSKDEKKRRSSKDEHTAIQLMPTAVNQVTTYKTHRWFLKGINTRHEKESNLGNVKCECAEYAAVNFTIIHIFIYLFCQNQIPAPQCMKP